MFEKFFLKSRAFFHLEQKLRNLNCECNNCECMCVLPKKDA